MTIDRTSRPPALFIGDHLAIDFVNSTSTPSNVRTEWLRDGADLVDWLEQAGAIDSSTATKFRRRGVDHRALDTVAEQARRLRGWLREFIERHSGSPLTAAAAAARGLTPRNRLLAQEDAYSQVEAGEEPETDPGHPLRLRRVRLWTTPDQLLQPIAEAIADLVCHADFRLIRACEGTACTLVFLDRTKSHARRWCSMAVCGNRAKAAAHRARTAGKSA